jgi:uncharacterized YccA/Bax inhibitor family protein
MAQTRGQSAVETVVGTAVGLLVSVAANMLVLPVFGFSPNLEEAGQIGVVFTLVSIARSYMMRRLFNRLEVRG